MTNEEFWDFFCEEGTTEEKYEKICEFFSKELDADFLENYDYEAVIFDTINELFHYNEFKKTIDFINLLEEKQTNIFQDNLDELISYLINYYCFLDDEKNCELVFSKYINNRIKYPYLYMSNFDKMLYYQNYLPLLKQVSEKSYQEIFETDDKEKLEVFLSSKFLFYTFLSIQVCVFQCGYNKKAILKELNKTFDGFDKNNKTNLYIKIINEIVKEKPSKEELLIDFSKSKEKFYFRLVVQFFKYMNEKQVGMPLSWSVWTIVRNLWSIKKEIKEPDLIFKISPKRFQKELREWENIDKLDDDKYFLLLWGSVYVYDFLKSIDIISDETYNHFINMTKYLKGVAIYKHFKYLWNFNFIHTWNRPDSISEEEFVAENDIFDKTFDNYIYNFHSAKKLFKKELQNLGELSDYIFNCEKIHIEQKKRKRKEKKFHEKINRIIMPIKNKDKDDVVLIYDFDENIDKVKKIQKPVEVESKVGRNDPCPCGSGKKYKKCCMNK